MKLKKLTIHNLASIEDAMIDFEAEPLSDSEVFLITGKTGAGKSTILDAICLALYATTPRLVNTSMQGRTNDGTKEVMINDPRQMLRRNTGEGFADLSFTGSNGVNYAARWGVKRARKKASGKLQNKEWELTNTDTNVTLSKDDEIKAEIRAAVGLDFNQFCRTTMLAQGEFTRFLNSKDDDKAAILEKITGVDIYSKIGAKVYAITRDKEILWEDAKKKLEGTTVLSPEEVDDYETQIAAIAAEVDKTKKIRQEEDDRIQWIRQDTQMSRNLSLATQSLEKAIQATKCEEFEKDNLLVTQWNETIEVRKWLEDAINAGNEEAKQRDTLGRTSKQFMKLEAGRHHLIRTIKEKTDQERLLTSKIDSEKERSKLYAQAQVVENMLTSLQDNREKLEEQKRYAAAETERMDNHLKPAKEKADKDVEVARTELNRLEGIYKELDQLQEAANLTQLRKDKEAQSDMLNNISIAFVRIDNYNKSKQKREKDIKSLQETEEYIAGKKAGLENLEERTKTAQTQMETLKRLLDKQRETVDKWAKNIRQKLQVGDICPVCQQKIATALPHEDMLESLYAEAEAQYNGAEREYTELLNNKNELEAEIKLQIKQQAKAKKDIEKDNSVESDKTHLAEACKNCGIASEIENASQQLVLLEEKTKAEKDKTQTAIDEGEKIVKATKNAFAEVEKQRKLLEKKKDTALKQEKQLERCKTNIDKANQLTDVKKTEIADSEMKLSQSIDHSLWGEGWRSHPTIFASELKDAAKKYNEMVTNRDKTSHQLEHLITNLENVNAALDATLTLMPEWKEVMVDWEEEVDHLLEKANRLRSDTQATKELYESAMKRKLEAEKKYTEYLIQHTEISDERLIELQSRKAQEIDALEKHIESLRDAVLTERTKLQQLEHQQREHMLHKPEISECDTEEAASARKKLLEEKLNALGESKGGIQQKLKQDEENKRKKSLLLEEADKCKSVYDKWSRLCQLIGDSTGNKFRKVAQSYVLASLIHSANHYMLTLSDRYQLKVSPGSFVIELEDAYQGYVSRASSTISGGESFLVSLSLALALSDIGHQLEVDTLFIDEGFGTLSGEPLQNAINTLRSLHHKAGRHVGIISHVEELQERIPVQIRVMQEGNNSSSRILVTTQS